jgi:hypothetical protein
MFMAQIVVMVLWGHFDLQIHQILHIKYTQISVYQSYPKELILQTGHYHFPNAEIKALSA